MAESKYGKNLIKAPLITDPQVKEKQVPMLAFQGEVVGVNVGWMLVPILEARTLADEPHKHDFHQFLCFLGSDLNNIGDLGAEIEITLGEEGEKHVITTPTIVHIPPGLLHCPLTYKKISKPVINLDVFLAPKYGRKEQP